MKLTPKIKQQLIRLVGKENLCTDETSLALYGYDCSLSRTRPDAVVLVQNRQQIAPLLRIFYTHRIPFVAHASSTNHAGGCAALEGGVILHLGKLNQILEINTRKGFAIVEPGVVVKELQDKLTSLGFFYAPDPASEAACTIGGNLAQNASGARCMKYGGTLDHVLAMDFVLPDGTELSVSRSQKGPDWIGLLAGSEGTLGIFTKLTLKILPLAAHIQTFLITFPSLQESVQAVSDLTAHGVIPRCIEAMDQLTTQVVENFSHAGYPTNAAALLLVELDGNSSQIKKETTLLETICRQHHALEFQTAKTQEKRQQLWSGRKSAFSAMAQLSPNVMVGDGTVPRSELPKALSQVQQVLKENQVRAGLLFHAGDGNFHPHLLFDQRNKLETQHVHRVMNEILKICIHYHGTLSGEHGVGVEKRMVMANQYDVNTLDAMARIKRALDPTAIANPLKIFPHKYQEKALTPFPVKEELRALQIQQEKLRKESPGYIMAGLNTKLNNKQTSILSTASLCKILEIDTANYTVTAQAGISLSQLQTALKKAGVYSLLPAGKGSLGGAFCSGCFPSFYSHVLGVEALLPNGSFIYYGGKITKNAAGYPLSRLFAGSQGSFGLVTCLTFKVFATPVPTLSALPFEKAIPDELWKRVAAQFATSEGENTNG